MKPKTYTVKQVKNELMKNPEFRLEYAKLQTEKQLAKQLISARLKKLAQALHTPITLTIPG